MITITDKRNCCACQACANSCPKKCITVKADEEGFLYPHVDETICINCGLCEKVCPILHKPSAYAVLETYAAKHTDEKIKLRSSSGAVFSALSEVILQQGGVVFGAAFDKEWKVVHTYAEKVEDLDKLRRSKYVQSDIGQTYQQARSFLEQGRLVLFTATPCQIAGLRNYLGKEYPQLITAELFCHGVPSPSVWQKFLQENTRKEQIAAIDFRHKRFGWDVSFLNITYKNGSCVPSAPRWLLPVLNAKRGFLFREFYRLPFYISNLYERPSCHSCRFKGLQKQADFSMGDLWGVQKTYPAQYDPQGISVLLVNTPKAQKILEKCNLSKQKVDISAVVQYNPYLVCSVKPHPKRAEFFARYSSESVARLIISLSGQKKPLVRVCYWIGHAALRKCRELLGRIFGCF